MPAVYDIIDGPPDAQILLDVRGAAGMTVYPLAQAERGVANSIFGVTAQSEGDIIGDGGFFYDVVDIAVRPEDQERGVGKQIMARLVQFILDDLPETSFVSLQADRGASGLYEQFGFRDRGVDQPGMAFRRELL